IYNETNSGLPSDWISCLAIDDKGDKWIGTSGGLVKYDGENWTTYDNTNSDLPDDYVRCITIDSNGDKWIGTGQSILLEIWYGGLAKFDDINWTVYTTTNSGLWSDFISCLAIDNKGDKWIGTLNGIVKYDGLNWTNYDNTNSGLPHDHVKCITIDSNGDKWIGTYYDGLAIFDGINWTSNPNTNSDLPSRIVNCITIDDNDDKWIGTSKGIVKFDGINWTIYNETNSGLPYDYVECITIDINGDKWIGTDLGGLAKFDGINWTTYNEKNSGLPDYHVECITIDTNGDKWIGTSRGGLAKFDGTNWNVYDTTNTGLPDNHVECITIDTNGNKWIGTEKGGLAKFDGTNWTVFNESNSGLPYNWVMCITIDNNGCKWIGTLWGIVKFDGLNWTMYNLSNSYVPDNTINCITLDGFGDKWIGTGNGLAKFDDICWTVYDRNNSGLPENAVGSVTITDNGEKWIAGGAGPFETSDYGMVYYYEKVITESIYSDFCGGDKFEITFSVIEFFDGNNQFTVHLSDENGYFHNDSIHAVLGSKNGKNGGTISAEIPNDIPYSHKYRIRVSASSPFARGVDNGRDITIHPLPKPEISNLVDTVFPGSIVEYKTIFGSSANFWKVQGGIFESDSTTRKVNITWGKSGTGKLKLIQTNENGCTDSIEYEVTILSIKPDISGKQNVCEEDLEVYVSQRIPDADMLWTIESGGTLIGNSTSDSIKVQWGETDNGILKLSQTLNGYTEERIFNVNIQPRPDKPTIERLEEKLVSSSETGNQWFHNDTIISGATEQILTPSPPSGTFQVQVTGANGCLSEMSDKYDYDQNPQVRFVIGDGSVLRAKPGDPIFVPIYMYSTYDIESTTLESVEARLRYNYTLLKPVDITGQIAYEERIITLDIPYNKQEHLKTLNFKAELGNSISTELVLDNISFTGTALSTTSDTYSAVFELDGVCMEGGYPRLISNIGKAQLLLLSPNPTTESCELEYQLIEKGQTKIYICNTYGEVIETIFRSPEAKPGRDKLNINTSSLSTGMYFIILETPTIKKVIKMEVLR
ncbi:T9SS type A sorting domain-containing protein, partial [Bacteroidota bacterium]